MFIPNPSIQAEYVAESRASMALILKEFESFSHEYGSFLRAETRPRSSKLTTTAQAVSANPSIEIIAAGAHCSVFLRTVIQALSSKKKKDQQC